MKYFHIGRGAVLTSLALHYLAFVQVLCGLIWLLIPFFAQGGGSRGPPGTFDTKTQ